VEALARYRDRVPSGATFASRTARHLLEEETIK
jgi:hypothetical protein